MPFDELGWQPPEVTPEVEALIMGARVAEESVREALLAMDAARRDFLVQTMVVGDAGAACEPPLDPALGIEELCEACLEARGPFVGADDRCMLRERSRIHLHLARASHPLRGPQDLLAMWDEATRREPMIRLFVDEPRWRTEADGIPFTGARMSALFDPVPLKPGLETADPADIPQLAETIASFARRDDLPPEVVALGLSYLIFRIHPFVDGNGHTLRMLACDIMHRAGYSELTLLAYIDALRAAREELCDLSIDVALGKARTQDHIAFHLGLVLQAQGRVLSALVPG